VEITNPGGLPPGMSYSDLGRKSMPRNFLLFGLMQRMGLVEKVGTGIMRMNHAMKEYNLGKPVMEADENWFTIIFKRPELERESFEGRGKTTPQKTTQKTTQKILGLIKENPDITRRELASIIGISEDGIKYHLTNLKNMGSLERIGPDKGGYWRIVGDDE
jgi:ATP-dependent DNA helicase RecG